MSENDPYHTYTDYWPCKPASRLSYWTIVLLVIALGVVFGLVTYWFAIGG